MASTPEDPRPLSPHVLHWRWHLTMATSILHRVSGVALYVGAFLLVAWLVAAAAGPDAYVALEDLMLSFLGRLVLFGFTLAAAYHFANGVRHLIWDAGAGFEPKTATAASVFILLFTALAALAVWAAAYWLKGGAP